MGQRKSAIVAAGALAICVGSVLALVTGPRVLSTISVAVVQGPTSHRLNPGDAVLMALAVCLAFAGAMLLADHALDKQRDEPAKGNLPLAALLGVVFCALSLGVGLAYMGSAHGSKRVFGRQSAAWGGAASLAWLIVLVRMAA